MPGSNCVVGEEEVEVEVQAEVEVQVRLRPGPELSFPTVPERIVTRALRSHTAWRVRPRLSDQRAVAPAGPQF